MEIERISELNNIFGKELDARPSFFDQTRKTLYERKLKKDDNKLNPAL